jgi:hypothetical protein
LKAELKRRREVSTVTLWGVGNEVGSVLLIEPSSENTSLRALYEEEEGKRKKRKGGKGKKSRVFLLEKLARAPLVLNPFLGMP